MTPAITSADSANHTPAATGVKFPAREIVAPSRQYLIMVALVISGLALVYLATMREGHEWGDDFSLYILHARNLADGRSYADTGYIYNPLYNSFGPVAYPPVLPVLLAPVYKLFGLNLTAMKLLGLLMFFGALFALVMSYRNLLPWPYGVGVIVLTAMNPYFWDLKDRILSDIPFLFFAYTALYAIERYYKGAKDTYSRHWKYTVLIAVLIYLSYGTRVIGGILILTLVLFDVTQKKKLTIFAVGVSLAAAALIIIQGSTLPSAGGGYLHWIQDNMKGGLIGVLLQNGFTYTVELANIWGNGYNRWVMYGLYLFIGMLALIGLVHRFRQGPKVHEWFFLLYILALFVIPAPGFRYLIPIVPLYILYAVLGAKQVSTMPAASVLRYTAVAAAAAITLSYGAKFSTMEYGRLSSGVGTPESKELFQFVRQQTEPDSVIIFRKPRALALFSDRKASVYPKPSPPVSSWDDAAWKYFHDINARYLIVAASWHADGASERRENEWITQFVERYSERCERVFANRDFSVYRLRRSDTTYIKISAMASAGPMRPAHLNPLDQADDPANLIQWISASQFRAVTFT